MTSRQDVISVLRDIGDELQALDSQGEAPVVFLDGTAFDNDLQDAFGSIQGGGTVSLVTLGKLLEYVADMME